MEDEKFLEKLIRLAWDNGYEQDMSENRKQSKYVIDRHGSDETHLVLDTISKDTYTIVYSTNIERIIFDHAFIRVLCELNSKLYYESKCKMGNMSDVNKTLKYLVIDDDRLAYLKQEFGDLVSEGGDE